MNRAWFAVILPGLAVMIWLKFLIFSALEILNKFYVTMMFTNGIEITVLFEVLPMSKAEINRFA